MALHILDLPDEILLNICEMLEDVLSVLRLSITCTTFRRICGDDTVWKKRCLRRANVGESKPDQMTWLELAFRIRSYMPVRWDSHYKANHLTVLNNGFQVQFDIGTPNNNLVIFGDRLLTRGMHYWELTILECRGTSDNFMIGISARGINLNQCLGYDSRSVALFGGSGSLLSSASYKTQPYGTGDRVGVFLDMDTLSLGFTVNGKWFGYIEDASPALDPAGVYPAISMLYSGDTAVLDPWPKWPKEALEERRKISTKLLARRESPESTMKTCLLS